MATSWEVTVVFQDGSEVCANSDTEPVILYGGDGLVTISGVSELPYVKRDNVLYVLVTKDEEV